MRTSEYFSNFTNKTFHDFTTTKSIPMGAESLLGLGRKFIPTPKTSIKYTEIDDGLSRHLRNVYLNTYFAGEEEEKEIDKLRICSKWMPDSIPDVIIERVSNFNDAIRRYIKPRRGKSNITLHQATILDALRKNESVIVTQADKNLGPVAVDTSEYIRIALDDHLLDTSTYVQVPESDAKRIAYDLFNVIYLWTREYENISSLSVENKVYIRHHINKNLHDDPFGYFYLLMKIHKKPMSSRPVCSDCASVVFPLGEWLNQVLQPIAIEQHSYIKDSFSLKRELNELTLPPNASLITFDAISMYTNIDINHCIDRISLFLPTIFEDEHECKGIIEALDIVMHNNRFRFGDLIFHQIRGVAMGMSPAPTIANLYVAIYEASNILPLLDKYIYFYRRFIDDGFVIWLHDDDPTIDAANLSTFKSIINNSGLKWTFSEPCNKLNYLDMTIWIENGKILTSLFAKPMALYQYIPPSSCHPPGVLTGLVLGQVLRIFQLCSRTQDIDIELCLFYQRLIDRGYNQEGLLPLFVKGVLNAESYIAMTQSQRDARKKAKVGRRDERVFFHMPYHPQNPPSTFIQRLWRDHIFSPPGEEILTDLRNSGGYNIPIKRLTIAYHRNVNISNLLSYRTLSKRTGLKTSSFI